MLPIRFATLMLFKFVLDIRHLDILKSWNCVESCIL